MMAPLNPPELSALLKSAQVSAASSSIVMFAHGRMFTVSRSRVHGLAPNASSFFARDVDVVSLFDMNVRFVRCSKCDDFFPEKPGWYAYGIKLCRVCHVEVLRSVGHPAVACPEFQLQGDGLGEQLFQLYNCLFNLLLDVRESTLLRIDRLLGAAEAIVEAMRLLERTLGDTPRSGYANDKHHLMLRTAAIQRYVRVCKAAATASAPVAVKADVLLQLSSAERLLAQFRVQLNEWHPVAAVQQMDGVESSIVSSVLQKGSAFIGSAVKNIFSTPDRHDSPAVVGTSAQDVALADTPREVHPLAFHKESAAPDFSDVCQQSTHDAEHLLNRCRVPSLYSQQNWPVAHPAGTSLFNTTIHPGVFPKGSTTERDNTFLSYLNEFYALWRGEIVFTVEVIATRFHQGQLFLAFDPSGVATPTLSDLKNCLCATLDLSLSNRTDFLVPFVSDSDYKFTLQAQFGTAPWVTNSHRNQIGRFHVVVQNPLLAPPSVSPNIQVNLYIRAGSSFQFALPRAPAVTVFVDGADQGDEVTVTNARPVNVADAIEEDDFVNPLLAVSTWKTADTGNVLAREYLLQTGVSWASSKILGDSLLDVQVPNEILTEGDIAIAGLTTFHSYMRFGIRFTLRFNSSPFYAGLCCLYFNPGDEAITAANVWTVFQLKHVLFNPAGEQTVSLDVPWAYWKRMRATFALASPETYGHLGLVVISPLLTPPSANTTLTASLWFTTIDPYIGVKRVGGVTQGDSETSASARGVLKEERTWDSDGQTPSGYLGDHMDVLDLMRRPDRVTHVNTSLADTLPAPHHYAIANIRSFLGGNQLKLGRLWRFWSGSRRIHLFSPSSVSNLRYVYLTTDFTPPYTVGPVTPALLTAKLWNGTYIWRPGNEPSTIVQIPYYHYAPLIRCPSANAADLNSPDSELAVLHVSLYNQIDVMQPAANAPEFGLEVFTSAGDDFHFYLPLPAPQMKPGLGPTTVIDPPVPPPLNMRGGIVAKQVRAFEQGGWIRDLTREGVEKNPGPVFSKPSSDSFARFVADTAEPSDPEHIAIRDLDRLFAQYQTFGQGPSRLSQLWEGCIGLITRTVSKRVAMKAQHKLAALKDDFSKAIVPCLIWGIDFILNVYIIATTTSTVAKTLAFTSLGMKLVLAYKYGSVLLDKLTEAIQDPLGFIMQGDTDYSSVAIAVSAALMAGLLGVMGHGFCVTDAKDLKNLTSMRFAEMCGGVAKISAGVRGVGSLWTAVVAGTKSAIAYFIDGDSLFSTWFDTEVPRIRAWQKRWDELKSTAVTTNNAAFKGRVGHRPYDEMCQLAEYARMLREKGPLLKTFPPAYLRTANEIVVRVDALTEMLTAALGRVEPVGIMVSGGAGCGKSFLTSTVLPRAVLLELGWAMSSEEAMSRVYCKPRNPDQQYMDGYISQPWVVIDDFGQNTDDKDFADIINLVSVSQCPIPMAAMEEKKTVFDSAIICCSTNLQSFHGVNTVKDANALARRFPITIKLEPVAAKFNALLFTQDLATDDVYTVADHHWKITTTDFTNPGRPGTVCTLAQLVRQIADLAREKQTVKARLDANFDNVKFALPVVARPQGDDECYWSATEDGPDYPARRRVWCQQVRECAEHHYGALAEGVLTDPDFYGPDALEYPEFAECYRLVTTSPECGPPPLRWLGIATYLAKTLALVAGAALAVTLLVRMIRSTFSYLFDVVEQGGYDKQGKVVDRKHVQVKGVRAVMHGPAEEVDAATRFVDKHQAIARNVRRVQFVVEGVAWGMNCLAIDAKHILVPKHFYKRYCSEHAAGSSPRLELEIVNRAGERLGFRAFAMSAYNTQELHGPEIMHSCSLDAVLVRLTGANIDHARDILHFVKPLQEYKGMLGTEQDGYFLGVRGPGCKAVFRFHHLVTCNGNYAYPGVVAVPSENGDCGRPYTVAEASDQHPLVGMHVVWIPKDKMIGMVPLIRECIDVALVRLDQASAPPVKVVEVPVDNFVFNGGTSPYWNTTIENHGSSTYNNVPLERHVMDKTQFVRTPWQHAEWIDKYAPTVKRAVILPGDKIHPLYTNAQKYENCAPYVMPPRIHRQAIKFLKTRIDPLDSYQRLSDDDAINGIGSMTPLAMTTSPGYWSAYFKNGKKELFDAKPITLRQDGSLEPKAYLFSLAAKERVVPLHNATFYDHYQQCEKWLLEGRALPTFWVSTLKDELRDVRKVAIGKTRVFEQPGLEFTLLMRKYFGHFVDYYKAHPGFRLFHGIGVDKTSAWGAYWRELNVWDGEGFDLDYSNFDGTVPVSAFEAFLELTDHFYGDQDRVARHTLIHSLRDSLLIVGRDFVEATQGNKSGNPLTDMFNSICGSYLILCFYGLSREMHGFGHDLDTFDENVRMLTYGDDVIISCSPSSRAYFNRRTCIELAAAVGMKATNAAKDGVVRESDSLKELTFLKSPFVEFEDVVLAPLPIDVIHRELMWQHRENRGDETVMKQRIETGVAMMAHHGCEAVSVLLRQLREMGLNPEFDWDEWLIETREKQSLYVVEAVSGSRNIVPPSWEVPDDWQQWLTTVSVDWFEQGDDVLSVASDVVLDVAMAQMHVHGFVMWCNMGRHAALRAAVVGGWVFTPAIIGARHLLRQTRYGGYVDIAYRVYRAGVGFHSAGRAIFEFCDGFYQGIVLERRRIARRRELSAPPTLAEAINPMGRLSPERHRVVLDYLNAMHDNPNLLIEGLTLAQVMERDDFNNQLRVRARTVGQLEFEPYEDGQWPDVEDNDVLHEYANQPELQELVDTGFLVNTYEDSGALDDLPMHQRVNGSIDGRGVYRMLTNGTLELDLEPEPPIEFPESLIVPTMERIVRMDEDEVDEAYTSAFRSYIVNPGVSE